MKRILAAFMTALMFFVSYAAEPLTVKAAENEKTQSEYAKELMENTAEYVYLKTPMPRIGSIGGEWAILGLASSGIFVGDDYFADYYKNVEEYIKNRQGVLSENKYTEYSRVAIALTAIGADAENVGGYNLIAPLYDYDKTIRQGINGPVWALIAINCKGYGGLTEDEEISQKYIKEILSRQLSDGGFSLSDGGKSDIDITAMALCALSFYKERSDCRAAIDKALEFLSKSQMQGGGFFEDSSASSETISQVITALSCFGVSLSDKRFVKNGKTLFDVLCEFKAEEGGFSHQKGDKVSNRMATEQALYALCALCLFESGKGALYDMKNVTKRDFSETKKTETAVYIKPFSGNKTFADIDKIPEKEKIEALASRDMLSGNGDGLFLPQNTVTRAEFAAIISKGLGLCNAAEENGGLKLSYALKFKDISESDWFCEYIDSAVKNEIVSGVSDDEFNPFGIITREEAAVMILRAAKKCGISKSFNTSEIRDILSVFPDYKTSGEWAAEALAFCVSFGITDESRENLCPKENVTRAETAAMFFDMLKAANLI